MWGEGVEGGGSVMGGFLGGDTAHHMGVECTCPKSCGFLSRVHIPGVEGRVVMSRAGSSVVSNFSAEISSSGWS